MIFTVGYEGTDIDRFVATMEVAKIRQVADVRAVPISRKKGFSKAKLAERLQEAGIEYRHYVGLGDPKPGRAAAREGRFSDFRRIYREHLMSEMARLEYIALLDTVQRMPTALMCFERDPVTCHRSMVADMLSEQLLDKVVNLFADDPHRYTSAFIRNRAIDPAFAAE